MSHITAIGSYKNIIPNLFQKKTNGLYTPKNVLKKAICFLKHYNFKNLTIEYTKPIIEKVSPIKKRGSIFLSCFFSLVVVSFSITINS